MKLASLLTTALIAAAASAAPALAEDHTVKMLTRGPDGERMVFSPAYLEIAPGDTVTFEATDPTHNAQTIRGMLPEGAESFRGNMNQDVTVTFDEDGVYGVKCLPHYGMGMVALIKVGEGEAPNLEEAKAVRQPGQARGRFAELFEKAEADATQAGDPLP